MRQKTAEAFSHHGWLKHSHCFFPIHSGGGVQEYQRNKMKMEAGHRARTYLFGCVIRVTPRKFEGISEKEAERGSCTVNAIFRYLHSDLLSYATCAKRSMTGSKRPFVRIAWRKIANAMGTLREVKETLGLNALCPGNGSLEAALELGGGPCRIKRLVSPAPR